MMSSPGKTDHSALPASPTLEPVAIIGMACLFPQAPDLQAFWNNIVSGLDAVTEPVANWDADRYMETGRIKTPFGGYLKDLYRFDPREFGIMPNSMDGGEPDQFLALRVARDALADAGYLGAEVDHNETGIILGHSTYLHRGQVNVIQNHIALDQAMDLMQAAMPTLDADAIAQIRQMLKAKLPQMNADIAPGLVPNVMTGRIANRLNFKGPNYLVDAACSSSLLAVSAALDELRAGRSRLMLAGGVNASLPADVSAIFTQLGALSGRGKVRPFEAGSDGTLLGEGLGVVVLKRLADAQADGDRVYAVVRGVGQASDGRGHGLLAPSMEGQTLSLKRAYESTGIAPSSISMIEAHGTGIPLGDKTEIGTLKNIFGERLGEQGTMALGSVKSMISHCIPAAGIAGLIKTALALHHRLLPPTLCGTVNPELGIATSPLYVNTEAAPWIAQLGSPRRAGINSFGFGGINTHAIVEEAPEAALRPRKLTQWPFELCVFAADGMPGLVASLERVAAGLERNPGWQLAEVAASLAAADLSGSFRLAIVAKDRASLTKGIATALPKLRENKTAQWSTRGGVHFSREPIGGQLAFMFPGEGSQYLNMFADLALCFDEVRQWLDFWRGLYPDAAGSTRTDIVFPPASELTPERRKLLERRLHDMDVGSEAVMVGGQAMFSLLSSLGITADVMVGHSSGESSALAASGAVPAADLDKLAAFIRELNAVYQRVLGAGQIATGALLAVGALPAQTVHDQIAASGRDIAVAMDNCPNQLVLYGDAAAVEHLQASLTSVGGICMPLPFDRGYHTAAFGAVTTAFHAYYKSVKLAAPKLPLYSCATTERFPVSAPAVRRLASAQWSQTVRFRETISRMHADGVRMFVEVGPSGNLTAFMGDILADKPYLALATNMRRKHGLEQLLGTVGQLFVHGRPLNLGRLFETRLIRAIDFDATLSTLPKGVLLDNTMPTMRLTAADRERLQQLVSSSTPVVPERVAAVESPTPLTNIVADVKTDADERVDTSSDSDASDEVVAEPDLRGQVMADYFDVMRGFLAQQQSVVARWQGEAGVAGEPAAAGEGAMASEQLAPFLNAILEQDASHLVARCDLSVHRDNFLRDHVLSGRGSDTDPELLGLSCVPLMVSLEIMAEACAVLAGRTDVCSIENVRAFDWIALDDGEVSLEVQAKSDPLEPALFSASLRQPSGLAVSAQFRFVPAWRAGGLAELQAPRSPRWDGAEIYDAGMFHGPLFQILSHIEGWNDSGMDAQLSPVSLDGFFVDGHCPGMVLNPVLLDAMGQLAACWTAEYAGTDFNCFPSSIERIEFYRPCPGDEPGLRLRARQREIDSGAVPGIANARTWAFECSDASGEPLVRVENLANVFFHVPNRFYQVRRDPLNGWLGQSLSMSAASPQDGVTLWELPHLAEDFCAQSNAIFLRMLAHASLSFEERDEWRALSAKNIRQRRQWLLGRLCLKEAVRHWLHAVSGELVYPSDIVVVHDERGAPFVDGWWNGVLSEAPQVSLAHDLRTCMAAVTDPGRAVGIDFEDLDRVQQPSLLMDALSSSERAFVQASSEQAGDLLVRMWCAKEAAAKFLGTGLKGLPTSFEVNFTQANLGAAVVHHQGNWIAISLARDGQTIVALADKALNDANVS